jgi:tetratricopeptide (TPR) repeat protein
VDGSHWSRRAFRWIRRGRRPHGAVLTALVAGSVNSRHVREAYGLLLMVWVGFPFATYWLWRRLSGREIRLHAAFGGPLQPRWQSLVLLVSGPLVLSTFYFYYATIQKKRRDTQIAVYEGRHLAEIGDVKSAIAAFQKAQRLDPDIDLDPTTKSIEKDPQAVAQKFADLGAPKRKLQEAFGLARLHDTDKALKAYAEAEKLDPLLATDANFWNRRAWYLTLGGNAKSGLEASEKAVRLAGKYLPNYRDTRGVARALTGDTQGAIQDFEAFIASDPVERKKAQRQEWINALRRGQMPFTPELLETLWSQ